MGYLSTFLSAPVSGSETSTTRKPLKSTTETVDEGLVRTEKQVREYGAYILILSGIV